MPTYPPRTTPIKKQEELNKKESELVIAIKKKITTDKLQRFLEKYRQAQLAMLKANIHHYKENELSQKETNINTQKFETLIIEWNNKTLDEILTEVKVNMELQ